MKIAKVSADFKYIVKGDNPRLLIHTGTHGDEHEVIEVVKKALDKWQDRLPDLVFVPEVSPSAVKNKSRFTGNGFDINRVFEDYSNDPEVLANSEVVQKKNFDLFVSFHEDHEFEKEYYIYDVGRSPEENKLVVEHNKYLASRGIELLNRVDSPEDPALGFLFVDGYKRFVHQDDLDRGIAGWIMDKGFAGEYLMPEIPMRADLSTKEWIVDSFFEMVIVKYFA